MSTFLELVSWRALEVQECACKVLVLKNKTRHCSSDEQAGEQYIPNASSDLCTDHD